MTAEDGGAVVNVDKDMIGRVLINLIENAVKYTPVGGRIEPGLKRVDGGVVFWVQDNGPGIPMDQRANVFNKFARLGGGRHGFGLGLEFCRQAVEAHQGKIWIEDVDGQGVRFAFMLPEVKG